MDNNGENQNLPVDSNGEKKKLLVRIRDLRKKRAEYEAQNDIIFSERLSEPKEDRTAPLRKGSVDMWFLLWAMILLCFGIVAVLPSYVIVMVSGPLGSSISLSSNGP